MKCFSVFTKLKNLFFVLIVLILAIISTACNQQFNNNTTSKDEYITLTYSRNTTDDVNSPIVNEFWYYDSADQEMNKIFETEYTSQYPLGFYDKKNNRIYYTKNVKTNNNSSGDQIFLINLDNSNEIQLTDDLFAVNNIYAIDDLVFFVARPFDSKVLKVGLLDTNTGKTLYWGDENTIEDTNIEAITVDKANKRIYVSAYSETERRYNVLHQDGPPGQSNFKMPLYTVYETDFSFSYTRKLFSEYEWIRAIMTKDNYVITLSDKQYNNGETPSTLIQYNLSDNSLMKSEWDTNRLQVGDANYSRNGKEIYAITTIGNKRGLYSYDIESNKFIEIYAPETGFVNNIQVVK